MEEVPNIKKKPSTPLIEYSRHILLCIVAQPKEIPRTQDENAIKSFYANHGNKIFNKFII
jgi:hypothetical protein